jgi:hypothetical protein
MYVKVTTTKMMKKRTWTMMRKYGVLICYASGQVDKLVFHGVSVQHVMVQVIQHTQHAVGLEAIGVKELHGDTGDGGTT